MKRAIAIAALAVFAATAPNAAADLVQVPAACGTMEDVYQLLSRNMPHPKPIGKGGDSRGNDLVVLFAGSNYWALVAKLSPNQVCIVASGRNWHETASGDAKAF